MSILGAKKAIPLVSRPPATPREASSNRRFISRWSSKNGSPRLDRAVPGNGNMWRAMINLPLRAGSAEPSWALINAASHSKFQIEAERDGLRARRLATALRTSRFDLLDGGLGLLSTSLSVAQDAIGGVTSWSGSYGTN